MQIVDCDEKCLDKCRYPEDTCSRACLLRRVYENDYKSKIGQIQYYWRELNNRLDRKLINEDDDNLLERTLNCILYTTKFYIQNIMKRPFFSKERKLQLYKSLSRRYISYLTIEEKVQSLIPYQYKRDDIQKNIDLLIKTIDDYFKVEKKESKKDVVSSCEDSE